MMYRREVFEQLGGLDEELNTSEDYEFNLKCLHAGLKIGYCPKVLAIYRRHDRQKVRMTEPREQRMKRDMIRKRYSV
jgi:GT2 family glycosyltransferase